MYIIYDPQYGSPTFKLFEKCTKMFLLSDTYNLHVHNREILSVPKLAKICCKDFLKFWLETRFFQRGFQDLN